MISRLARWWVRLRYAQCRRTHHHIWQRDAKGRLGLYCPTCRRTIPLLLFLGRT